MAPPNRFGTMCRRAGKWYAKAVEPVQVLRWRMRKLLSMMPAARAREGASPRNGSSGAGAGEIRRIAYLFAGTYGDFAQCLAALRRLASAHPKAEVIVFGAEMSVDFRCELPRNVRPSRPGEFWWWIAHPVDLLFTNSVGVYRVRFDYLARFCARKAFGFRHAHESDRGGYAVTHGLYTSSRSFAEENLRLLDLAAVKDVDGLG